MACACGKSPINESNTQNPALVRATLLRVPRLSRPVSTVLGRTRLHVWTHQHLWRLRASPRRTRYASLIFAMAKPAPWTMTGAKVRGPEKKPKRKRVRAQSTKQAQLSRKWHALRDNYLAENQRCLCCGRKATEVHHRRGRGRFLLVREYLMSVCGPCHGTIHREPKWATAKGYMVSRLSKT